MKMRNLAMSCALALLCCQSEKGPNVGSETHFLMRCIDSESCQDGLSCLCGVCSAECSDSAVCLALSPDAQCISTSSEPQNSSCEVEPSSFSCEVSCGVDAACASLGENHICAQGVCRELASDCEQGLVSADEVVLLGDLFLANSQQITFELEERARAVGAILGEARYRDHSSGLVDPFGEERDPISQYVSAREEGEARVVIMGVGGPDALLSCPEPLNEDCPTLQNARTGTADLLAQMAEDGVEQVVLFFYPDPQSETLTERFGVLSSLLQPICQMSALDCHFLELRPFFSGREDVLLVDSGLLPSAEGSKVAAEAIWNTMQQYCIAQ